MVRRSKFTDSLDCLFECSHAGDVTSRTPTPQRSTQLGTQRSAKGSTQGERTRAMRSRLLDATLSCLVELGWAGTTTTVVSQRAGGSRGAQLHHCPSKQDLVVAAVEHVMQRRREQMDQAVSNLPADGRTRAVLEILADYFTSDLFFAALEIWTAARTDEQLLSLVAPLERSIGRDTHRHTVAMLHIDESLGDNRRLIQATLDLIRGLGLAATLSDDSVRRNHILDAWADTLDAQLVTS